MSPMVESHDMKCSVAKYSELMALNYVDRGNEIIDLGDDAFCYNLF